MAPAIWACEVAQWVKATVKIRRLFYIVEGVHPGCFCAFNSLFYHVTEQLPLFWTRSRVWREFGCTFVTKWKDIVCFLTGYRLGLDTMWTGEFQIYFCPCLAWIARVAAINRRGFTFNGQIEWNIDWTTMISDRIRWCHDVFEFQCVIISEIWHVVKCTPDTIVAQRIYWVMLGLNCCLTECV